ncbi:glutathione S-transferase C-terminal-like protein [Lentinus brumalis]|uniref:Glutathione S-transferase C-terminal-like protein n=1 Tax=Lentinus brumalis TaxID=2498619 RepID=A0A371CXR6_9APHY|nr:glutathione S-transferase C-terminal-like protein [Polyporus brumalis]
MSPPEKKQRTEEYILYYWPGIPGRGEYVRLAFEYAGISYRENSKEVPGILAKTEKVGIPPHFAPPALRLPSGRVVSQTPAILNHIAPRCGLAGPLGSKLNTLTAEGKATLRELSDEELEKAEEERSVVNQLTLTVLDWCNESHDVHHPCAASLYYEDQKEAAAQAAEVFRKSRLPRWLEYFQSVLASNPATAGTNGGRTYLYGKQTTTADLALFHVVDGTFFAFPKRLGQLKASGEYDNVFALYERVKGEKGIKEYIESGRRQKFSMGLFRHYEELDGEEKDE